MNKAVLFVMAKRFMSVINNAKAIIDSFPNSSLRRGNNKTRRKKFVHLHF